MNKPTLEEFLESVDGSEWIYLGCKKGSGWMAIERAEDMKNNLEAIEKKYYDRHLRLLESSIRRIISAPDTRKRAQQSLDASEEKMAKAKNEVRKETVAIRRTVSLNFSDPEKLRNELTKPIKALNDAYKECEDAVKASNKSKNTLDNLESNVKRATSTKENILSNLGTWVHFSERQVLQQYRKDTDPHEDEDGSKSYGIAVLIEGDERAPYWTYNDVLNGVEEDFEEE